MCWGFNHRWLNGYYRGWEAMKPLGFNQPFLWHKMRMYHLVINGWLENPYQWRFRKFIELFFGGDFPVLHLITGGHPPI